MWILFLFLLAGAFVYLYWLNDQIVAFVLRPDMDPVEMPLALLVFLAAMGGAFLAALTSAISRGRKAMRRWSERKLEKKRSVAEEAFRKGMARMSADDLQTARECFAQALEVYPDYLPARMAEVEIFRKLGDLAGARKRIESLVERDPKNLDFAFKLAQVLAESGEDLAAAEELRKLLSQEGRRSDWWSLLARCYFKAQRWDDAMESIDKAIKLGGGGAEFETLRRESAYLRARSLDQSGDAEAAAASLKETFSEKEDFPPAHLFRADLMVRLGRDDDAATHLEKCFSRNPDPVYLPKLEDLLIRRHDPNRIIRFYRKAVADHADAPQIRLLYANALLRLGLIDEALNELHSLSERQPTPSPVHLLAGEAHFRRQAFEKAGAEFRKALGEDQQLQVRYVCRSCGHVSTEGFVDTCPACKRLDAFDLVTLQ